MPLQSQTGNCFRSRQVPGLHSITALTAPAMFRLSDSPIQGITVQSASSGLSVPTTHPNKERYEDQEASCCISKRDHSHACLEPGNYGRFHLASSNSTNRK